MTDLGNFKGKAKPLEDMDLPRIGHRIGVGEDEIHAVLDVEAAGKAFDSHGRPKMLFEPHVFYRELGPGPERDWAVSDGLARRRWKRDYPKDSYARLKRAMEISPDKALRSASWGMGQVMGFNCLSAGYETARDMVAAFMDDADNHLEAMVSFIVVNHLDDELRRHDWAGFARGYNGKGFAQNHYDTKLAKAYAKWQKIKDTEWTPEAEKPMPEPAPEKPVTPKPGPIPKAAPLTIAGITVAALIATATGQLCKVTWLASIFTDFCGG